MPSTDLDFVRPGPYVGHYTTAVTAFEHILPSGQLRMSPYRVMRDPVENKAGPSIRIDALSGPEASAMFSQALLQASEIHESARLVSLTHDAVTYADGVHDVYGCAWARARLWEQYGDQHRGACLLFRRDLFEEAVSVHFAPLGVGLYTEEVAYTPGGYATSEGKTLRDPAIFDLKTGPQALELHIHRYHQDFFFLKSNDWASEYEYRVVIFGQGADFVFFPYGDSLQAVIVAEQFPAWQLPGAQAVCDQAQVPLVRVQWLGGRPVLS